MNTADRDEASSACIAVAAWFVAAQPGGAERILNTHRRRPDGCCACHAHTVTPWPCSAVTIAHAAQQHAKANDPATTGQHTDGPNRELSP